MTRRRCCPILIQVTFALIGINLRDKWTGDGATASRNGGLWVVVWGAKTRLEAENKKKKSKLRIW